MKMLSYLRTQTSAQTNKFTYDHDNIKKYKYMEGVLSIY